MSARYRVRFVHDRDATFEECNGEPRPLTESEYAENSYRACPDHPRAGTRVLRWKPVQVQGCAVCKRTDYVDIPYAEYRAYYGNPERHVYLQCDVERACPCCGEWRRVAGTGYIDLMDDSAEYRRVEIGKWYTPAEVRRLPGYLREVAREDLADAKADRS